VQILPGVMITTNRSLLGAIVSEEEIALGFRILQKIVFGSKCITHQLVFRLRTFVSSRPVDTSCSRQVCALICEGNQTEELRQIHFSFVSTERDGDLRTSVLPAFRRMMTRPSHFLSLQFLMHDRNPDIQRPALEMFVQALRNFETQQILRECFFVRTRDLTEGLPLWKDDISPFLVVCQLAADSSFPVASEGRTLIAPFAGFLVGHLLDAKTRLFTSSLELLSFLIPTVPSVVDVAKVCHHLSANLTVQCSRKCLTASLSLLAAVQMTALSELIYPESSTSFGNYSTSGHCIQLSFQLSFFYRR
jgi:hypothetical protein